MAKEMISIRKDKLDELLIQISDHLSCEFCPFGECGSNECKDIAVSVTCRQTLEEILKG